MAENSIYSGVEVLSVLRELIKSELDSITMYERYAALVADVQLKGVFRDIANEERVHVGELERLVSILDEGWEPSMDMGYREVLELLEENN